MIALFNADLERLAEAIRSDDHLKNTPILLLSNYYLPDLAQKAIRAGGSKTLSISDCTSSDLISVSRELVGLAQDDHALTTDTTLAEQLVRDLIDTGNTRLNAIREDCSQFVQLAGSDEGKACLTRVYQSFRLLSTRAGLAGCWKIAQLTGAVEAMLFEQLSRKGAMTASSIQTLAKAVDCLGRLLATGNVGAGELSCKARVLLV